MRSFLNYMGGKSLLAERIVKRIPEHTCYCEVFAGAAWLLFKKDESKVEIINDINIDLVTLFRVVKNHFDEFIRYLRWIRLASLRLSFTVNNGQRDRKSSCDRWRCHLLRGLRLVWGYGFPPQEMGLVFCTAHHRPNLISVLCRR